MSTKPSDAGRFAVDGSDVNAVNISAPSSGLRGTGFPNNYVPPAGEFNYLENIHYRWQQWLNDGDCAFHNLSASGTFAATGNATLGGTVGITGNTTVGGTLGVTSNETVGGTLGVTGAATVAAVTASGLITANAGVTAGANQHVTISGTGLLKHGTRSITYPTVLSQGGYSFGDTGPVTGPPFYTWSFQQVGTTTATLQKVYYPIILNTGTRILSWLLNLSKSTSSSHTITAKLFRVSFFALNTQIGTTQTNSTNSPLLTTIGQSGLTETVVAEQYYVEVGSPDSNAANGVDQAIDLTVTYDQP